MICMANVHAEIWIWSEAAHESWTGVLSRATAQPSQVSILMTSL